MNLIINPSFQVAQDGTAFAAIVDAAFCLDQWQGLTEVAGALRIDQNTNPLGCKMTWSNTSWGGILQILEKESYQAVVTDDRLFAFDAWSDGTIVQVTAEVIAWSGNANKPTADPVSAWGGSLTLRANYTSVWSQTFTVGAVAQRLVGPLAIPNANNLAVIIRAHGANGDHLYVRNVSLDRDSIFVPRPWQDESTLCDAFYQKYTTDVLLNQEWGFGRVDHGAGVIGFQFPMRNLLRGRLGEIGTQDVIVTWPVLTNGYFAYAGGSFKAFPTSGLVMTCHHGRFIAVSVPFANIDFPDQHVAVWRNYQTQPAPVITIDARLRP